MTREPIVAGQFYEDKPELLRAQIKECFMHRLGPGAMPGERKNPLVKAVISPHAGYAFSGPCAAFSYKEIAEAGLPDVFLILGPSHSGSASCFSSESWRTPLGTVSVDREFVDFLASKTGLPIDNRAHAHEHSIEVQLPFLQFAPHRNLRIAPLMVSHDQNVHGLGHALKQAVAESKKSVCIIVSSDFTHYGVNYGYLPFTSNTKENLYKLDRGAIDQILARSSGRFLDYVEDKRATICGALPIAVALDILETEKGELLQYYTSGDIIDDYSSAVGYSAIVFR
jgi:AmmeMemoRadiSam system protein B